MKLKIWSSLENYISFFNACAHHCRLKRSDCVVHDCSLWFSNLVRVQAALVSYLAISPQHLPAKSHTWYVFFFSFCHRTTRWNLPSTWRRSTQWKSTQPPCLTSTWRGSTNTSASSLTACTSSLCTTVRAARAVWLLSAKSFNNGWFSEWSFTWHNLTCPDVADYPPSCAC